MIPVWVATVEYGEVQFGALNETAKEQAANVEYPWGEPLVRASEVAEHLRAAVEEKWADDLWREAGGLLEELDRMQSEGGRP